MGVPGTSIRLGHKPHLPSLLLVGGPRGGGGASKYILLTKHYLTAQAPRIRGRISRRIFGDLNLARAVLAQTVYHRAEYCSIEAESCVLLFQSHTPFTLDLWKLALTTMPPGMLGASPQSQACDALSARRSLSLFVTTADNSVHSNKRRRDV